MGGQTILHVGVRKGKLECHFGHSGSGATNWRGELDAFERSVETAGCASFVRADPGGLLGRGALFVLGAGDLVRAFAAWTSELSVCGAFERGEVTLDLNGVPPDFREKLNAKLQVVFRRNLQAQQELREAIDERRQA